MSISWLFSIISLKVRLLLSPMNTLFLEASLLVKIILKSPMITLFALHHIFTLSKKAFLSFSTLGACTLINLNSLPS